MKTKYELPIVPTNEPQQEKTEDIESLIRNTLVQYCGINMRTPYVLFTITTIYIDEMVARLSDKVIMHSPNPEVSIGGLFKCYPSMHINDEAEKEGNINIVFELDEKCPRNVEDFAKLVFKEIQVPTNKGEDAIYGILPLTAEDQSDYKAIINNSQKILLEHHDIMFKDAILLPTIALTFIIGIVEYLEDYVNKTNKGVMYNLGDIVEINSYMRKGSPDTGFQPGIGAKLNIKHDVLNDANA